MRRVAFTVAVTAVAIVAAGCGSSRSVTALPGSQCGPIFYHGTGHPNLLIVSDLPLRNPPPARKQVAGIEYVLAQRDFKAGRYRVGYQSCDDSSARTNAWDPARCEANTKAYAQDRSIVGVIGPYNSPCAQVQIAAANKAPAGPLVMIGTATTDPELTAVVPGGDVGTPGKYYPTGVRNFVRLAAPDEFQAAAAVLLAKRLHLRRVFLLDDGEQYGSAIAQWFRRSAKRMGLPIVGSATWDPHAPTYTSLARRVADTRPDGVYLSGLSFPPLNGAAVLRAVRRRLPGRGITFFAPDGFANDAGSEAEGLLTTWAGVPPSAAGPLGQKLMRRTGRDHPYDYGALYGAAAASVLLDAISHSDGTRTSITHDVFAASTPAGIIGRFGFDRDGDPTVGAETVFRVTDGRAAVAMTLYPTAELAKGG